MATDPIQDVQRPDTQPICTPEQILTGEYIDPRDRIKLYSDAQFEDFVEEWAFFVLQDQKNEYVRVTRFGNAGDKGRDVIGYVDEDASPVICDVFQCKHYGHPLQPAEFLPELAKLCHHTFEKTIPVPRAYYIVAPQDIGATLGALLEDADELKKKLITEWKDTTKARPISKQIGVGEVTLDGDLETYVDAFNFKIIRHKPIQEIINEHRSTIRHAPRFGGGLTRPLPDPKTPPTDIDSIETRYVEQLVDVYRVHTGNTDLKVTELERPPTKDTISRHFNQSRERFYFAEALREFARDNLPENFTYTSVQDDVYDGVFDTVERDYSSPLDRVRETTDAASSVTVGKHPLAPYIKKQALRGICHQLANDDRIVWVRHANGDDHD